MTFLLFLAVASTVVTMFLAFSDCVTPMWRRLPKYVQDNLDDITPWWAVAAITFWIVWGFGYAMSQ